jgi:uncharacterized damage-inducible protein DinB
LPFDAITDQPLQEIPSMQTQPETIFVDLIRYNNWSNAQVFAACQKLAADQLAAAAPGAYGTLRDTLEHIIRAEADYVGRLTGNAPQPSFKWEGQPALADIAAFADQVAGALLDTAQRIPPTHLVHEEENGQTLDYLARALFIQVINHGIEHRTNITTILSGLGLPAPEVDGWAYLWSHPDQFELKAGSQ